MESKDIYHNIEKMIKYQDNLNNQILPGWKDVDIPFHRAIWVEAAELMNELNWKWWSSKEEDRVKVVGEVVDIWHFLMSALIKEGLSASGFVAAFSLKLDYLPADIYESIDILAETALRKLYVECLETFVHICRLLNIDFTTLTKNYIAKNVLNKFRQDRDIQKGNYNKVWGNKKDSEWVIILADSLEFDDFDSFRAKLYTVLEAKYTEFYYK